VLKRHDARVAAVFSCLVVGAQRPVHPIPAPDAMPPVTLEKGNAYNLADVRLAELPVFFAPWRLTAAIYSARTLCVAMHAMNVFDMQPKVSRIAEFELADMTVCVPNSA